jgi:hypothetical protein
VVTAQWAVEIDVRYHPRQHLLESAPPPGQEANLEGTIHNNPAHTHRGPVLPPIRRLDVAAQNDSSRTHATRKRQRPLATRTHVEAPPAMQSPLIAAMIGVLIV